MDRLGDLDHLGSALIRSEHATHQLEAHTDGHQCGYGGKDQPEPLGASQSELLVSPFRC